MNQERGADRDRQDSPLPADLLGPLREVVEALGEAQRRSERALQTVIDRLAPTTETRSDGTYAGEPAAAADPALRSPRVVPNSPVPPPRAAAPDPARVHPPAEAPASRDDADADRVQPAPWRSPVLPAVARDRDVVPVAPAKAPPENGDGVEAAVNAVTPAPPTAPARGRDESRRLGRSDVGAAADDPRLAVRRTLALLQRAANEVDRIADVQALDAYLWRRAQDLGLRGMRLQEKGRSLYAEDCFGFENFEGDRRARLRKVVVSYDPDGLFGVTGQERAVYSGPRPSKGLPVDLVLVMGKQAPAWCLVVPMPYRNRWGSFLYFDAVGDKLEAILELELVARLIVLQLRAARFRPHEPAERVRGFRAATLRDRQARRQRKHMPAPTPTETDGDSDASDAAALDPLSRKRASGATSAPPILAAPERERFDDQGRLVRPLDGRAILARMGDLPPMPHVATRLIGLLNDPQTEIATLQEIMATDQAISVRLLQIANSSLYGSMREVSTIPEAVMRLGFTAIRSWLLATVTRVMFTEGSSNPHRHRLWRQSVLNGLAAQLVAERTQKLDPDTAFTGGLLQNIGLLLLARNHPDAFEQIDDDARADRRSYFEAERPALGFDHADTGALVLEKWGLGDTLVTAVAAHHRLETAGDQIDFAAIIALAEELALRVGEGPTEESDEDLSQTPGALHLGLGASDVESILEILAERALDRDLFAG